MKLSRRNATRARRGPTPRAAEPVIPLASAMRVRWSRVASAQVRIAADFYDRGEVRDRLVEALLAELKQR